VGVEIDHGVVLVHAIDRAISVLRVRDAISGCVFQDVISGAG
jgi:hypothetical protein